MQQQLVDEVLPRYMPPATLCTARETWLEIGFGAGEHLLHVAQQSPERDFMGAEPYLNGVAKLLVALQNLPAPPQNLFILPDDVRPWLRAMAAQSLAGVSILFPDPWPKRAHHKRRLINAALLDLLADSVKPGGVLRIATDHVDYSAWIMEHVQAHPCWRWTAQNAADWTQPFDDWHITRYQQKTTQAGRLPIFLEFQRAG